MQIAPLPAVSNRADWIDAYKLLDDETGHPIDLSDATEITVEIRDRETRSPQFSATLSGGTVEHIETGIFQWSFSLSQMRSLCPKTYDVGLTILKDEITTQILIGTLPVYDGIVS
jgi:hypothetical protein